MTTWSKGLAALVAVAALTGCKIGEVSREQKGAPTGATPAAPAPAAAAPAVAMTLARPQVRPGEAITVTFGAPLVPPANQQYWITIIPMGQPEDAWGSWQYLPMGATTATLSTLDPGLHEIRLHDYYPHHPHRVIARQQVTVLPQ